MSWINNTKRVFITCACGVKREIYSHQLKAVKRCKECQKKYNEAVKQAKREQQ